MRSPADVLAFDPITSPKFACTDAGNAEFFTYHFQDRVKFDHRRGSYLVWHDHHWASDARGDVRRLVLESVRLRQRDALDLDDHTERTKHLKWAAASESRQRLDAIYVMAQSMLGIADDGTGWDADPMLVGVPNGVVDLATGELRDGEREDQITLQTGVAYDPDAACPRFEQFLHEIFAGDVALITFMQRAIGYALTGLTSEQCVFFCHGSGANGKSTLTKLLLHVFGDHGGNMPFSTVELHQRASIPNDLAALAGKRFVVASETNDGTRLNESRIKALSGCDPITARFLHEEFFTFTPCAKFFFAVNHLPIVRDDSLGFWRRVRLVPFAQRFAINAALGDELRGEAAGVLAWAVRGCLAWQRDGLQPPEVVLNATRTYEETSDRLAAFLEEAMEFDTAAEVGATEFYAHYKAWADRQGLSDRERLTATAFGTKATERFEKAKREWGNVYVGLSRKPLP